MIKNFLQFMKESQSQDEPQSQDSQSQDSQSQEEKVPTLHIINDIEYENPDTLWFITIDVKDIWKKYKEKTLNFKTFIKDFNEKLISNKNELQKISEACWTDLTELTKLANDYKEDDKNKYLNKIYDWGDEYGVKIDTVEPETQK
jgi:hypothetical protein